MELGFKCNVCETPFTAQHNETRICPKCFIDLTGYKGIRIFDYESKGVKFYNKKLGRYKFINEKI